MASDKDPPLVFLHGFLGTSADWEPVSSHFPSHESISINLPGHGEVPFTEHFFHLMPKVPKMHLIGYSMGGRLAMQFAQAFPEKIASLTIFSAHTGLSNPEEKQQRIVTDQLLAQKIVQSFEDFLHEWYKQTIFGGFVPDLTDRKMHNPDELAKTLVYYSLGTQDVIRPKKATFAVGERDLKYRLLQPNAIVVPNAGHMVHLEQPLAVAEIIHKNILNMTQNLHWE